MGWQKQARIIARQYGIPEKLFLRQISQESGGNPNAVSPAGAIGIMQIVPRWHPDVNPRDPIASMKYAAKWERGLYEKYGNWQDVLSVYNSGRPWSQGRGIGETNNYVHSILGGQKFGKPSASSNAPYLPQGNRPGTQASATSAFPSVVAASLLQTAARGGQFQPGQLLGLAIQRQQMQAAQQMFGPAPSVSKVTGTKLGNASGTGLSELFYDPLGGIKNGKEIGAIGNHSDHVHISLTNAHDMVRAIQKAHAMGLHTGENPYVGKVNPVHVKDSYHYRISGKVNGRPVGEGLDVSGDPRAMAAYYKWASRYYR